MNKLKLKTTGCLFIAFMGGFLFAPDRTTIATEPTEEYVCQEVSAATALPTEFSKTLSTLHERIYGLIHSHDPSSFLASGRNTPGFGALISFHGFMNIEWSSVDAKSYKNKVQRLSLAMMKLGMHTGIRFSFPENPDLAQELVKPLDNIQDLMKALQVFTEVLSKYYKIQTSDAATGSSDSSMLPAVPLSVATKVQEAMNTAVEIERQAEEARLHNNRIAAEAQAAARLRQQTLAAKAKARPQIPQVDYDQYQYHEEQQQLRY